MRRPHSCSKPPRWGRPMMPWETWWFFQFGFVQSSNIMIKSRGFQIFPIFSPSEYKCEFSGQSSSKKNMSGIYMVGFRLSDVFGVFYASYTDWGFLKWVYPNFSSFLFSDFPWNKHNKHTSYEGSPIYGTPIDRLARSPVWPAPWRRSGVLRGPSRAFGTVDLSVLKKMGDFSP